MDLSPYEDLILKHTVRKDKGTKDSKHYGKKSRLSMLYEFSLKTDEDATSNMSYISFFLIDR